MIYDPEMTDAIRQTAVTCLRGAMADEPWQDLGFRKRPKYGSFIQKLRSTWKVDLEKKVLREILISFTAAHVVGGALSREELREVVSVYSSSSDAIRALGYSSEEQASQDLSESIAQYIATPLEGWNRLLFARLSPQAIPDKRLSGRVLVGCAQFGINLKSMVSVLQRGI